MEKIRADSMHLCSSRTHIQNLKETHFLCFPPVPLRAAVSFIEFVFWYLYKTFPLWLTPSLKPGMWPHVNVHFYSPIISGLCCLKAYSELKWKTREVTDDLEAVCVLIPSTFAASVLAWIGSWHQINSSRPSKQIENVQPHLQIPIFSYSLQGFLLKSYSSIVYDIVSPSWELIFFPKLAWLSLDGLN